MGTTTALHIDTDLAGALATHGLYMTRSEVPGRRCIRDVEDGVVLFEGGLLRIWDWLRASGRIRSVWGEYHDRDIVTRNAEISRLTASMNMVGVGCPDYRRWKQQRERVIKAREARRAAIAEGRAQ